MPAPILSRLAWVWKSLVEVFLQGQGGGGFAAAANAHHHKMRRHVLFLCLG